MIDVFRLSCRFDKAGEIVGIGSSSPNDTPKARSLASLSSSTYASHSVLKSVSIDISVYLGCFQEMRNISRLLWLLKLNLRGAYQGCAMQGATWEECNAAKLRCK